MGTRLGFPAPCAETGAGESAAGELADRVPVPLAGREAAELAAEPDAAFSVVEIGPVAEPEVSDVAAL